MRITTLLAAIADLNAEVVMRFLVARGHLKEGQVFADLSEAYMRRVCS